MNTPTQTMPIAHDLNIGGRLSHIGKRCSVFLSTLGSAYRISQLCEQEINATGQVSPATLKAIKEEMTGWQ